MSYVKFLANVTAARMAGAPLVAVQTPDPAATIQRVIGVTKPEIPVFQWNRVEGLQFVNAAAEQAIKRIDGADNPGATKDPVGVLAEFAPALPPDSILFCMGVGRYLRESSVDGAAYVQALWNLRDPYKGDGRTLMLLAPDVTVPPELKDDLLVLDEPLPDDAALDATLMEVLDANEVPIDATAKAKAVDAIRGLAAFSAEQAVAMSVKGKVLDVDGLWERKRQMINQTPGLSVWQGGETFDDVGGCEQIKRFIKLRYDGKDPFTAVLWWDEIEKMFAGIGGDNTGVADAIFGLWLSWQQIANKRGSSAALFAGPPGSGKSMIAQTAGATFGVPTIQVDSGGTKSSALGASEAAFRNVLKVVDAIGSGRVLTLMTCNKQVDLRPEMKRRMTSGLWYFDLPDMAENRGIWAKKRALFKIDPNEQEPPSEGWTGAEIHNACQLHDDLRIPLVETTQFIVPVFKSAAEEIKALRSQADGTFLSASHPGVYTKPSEVQARVARRVAG